VPDPVLPLPDDVPLLAAVDADPVDAPPPSLDPPFFNP
jgi:hypothetical protein